RGQILTCRRRAGSLGDQHQHAAPALAVDRVLAADRVLGAGRTNLAGALGPAAGVDHAVPAAVGAGPGQREVHRAAPAVVGHADRGGALAELGAVHAPGDGVVVGDVEVRTVGDRA